MPAGRRPGHTALGRFDRATVGALRACEDEPELGREELVGGEELRLAGLGVGRGVLVRDADRVAGAILGRGVPRQDIANVVGHANANDKEDVPEGVRPVLSKGARTMDVIFKDEVRYLGPSLAVKATLRQLCGADHHARIASTSGRVGGA